MSYNVRVHIVSESCQRADGRWRPMISMWRSRDGVYIPGSYWLLLPDDFEAHIRRLRADGQTVPPEYEKALQQAREQERG